MYLRRRQKVKQEGERRSIFLRYLGEVAGAVSAINGADREQLYEKLLRVANARRRGRYQAGRPRPRTWTSPRRSLSNVRYNKRKRFIEMGKNTNRRELFNLSQAKSYMQTMLVASGCKQLIEQGKTTSIRGLYYLLKHTIEGTKEETFDDQASATR
jgi:DNA topoisomerase VI subunit A